MENAVDALKISFAVFIFIFAIAITFSMISKAVTTSDVVLYYTDETSFYDYEASKEENREVDVSTVITTLYKTYEENVTVKIKLNEEDDFTEFSLDAGTATEENINDYIDTYLLNLDGKKFEEEFLEVPYSGIYKTGNDGSQVTVSNGGKKIYITYELKA